MCEHCSTAEQIFIAILIVTAIVLSYLLGKYVAEIPGPIGSILSLPSEIINQLKKEENSLTNFDRIKAMSVDEMAKFITKEKTRVANSALRPLNLDISTDAIITSYEACKVWLESEAKE